jgi:hypothetical protein
MNGARCGRRIERSWARASHERNAQTIGSFAIWVAVMVGSAVVAMLLVRGGGMA